MINSIFSDNRSYTLSLGHLFWIITKEHPELVTGVQIDSLFSSINDYSGTSQELHLVFQGLGCVANTQPHLFHKHKSVLLRFIITEQNMSALTCLQQYLVSSTIVAGEQRANESLALLIDLLKRGSTITNDMRKQIFHTCQLIGVMNKQALAAKRADLEEFNSFPECRLLMDFIDGNKMSEENQATINQTLEEIGQVEKRVVKTEKDIDNVNKVVKRQELSVSFLFIIG